jgi:hypothetical protein
MSKRKQRGINWRGVPSPSLLQLEKKKRTGRLFSSTFGSIIVQLVGVITNTIREQRERESEAKKEIGNRIAAGGWRISYTSKFIRRYCWMIEMRNS